MDVRVALTQLTGKGHQVMSAIANRQVSFFDEGFVEGSGTWGDELSAETGQGSGVLNGLESQGFLRSLQVTGESHGKWWELTELGAEAVRFLRDRADAASEEFAEIVEDAAALADKGPFRNRQNVQPIEAQRRQNLKALTTQMYKSDRVRLATAIQACMEDLQSLADELDLDINDNNLI